MNNYRHLRIRPGLRWRRRYFFRRVFRRVARYLGELIKEEEDRAKYIKLLRDDSADAADWGSGYGYEDEVLELHTAEKYYDQLQDPDLRNLPSESPALYDNLVETVSEVLERGEIQYVLNFGVGYGYVDNLLAQRYPDVQFVGIDRSTLTKRFNQDKFDHIENLEFVAGDVFEYLNGKRVSNGLLMTARTLVAMPPSFVKKLFQAVFASDFHHVILAEQIGISRETNRPYEFSDNPKPSVLFRRFMFIHNYLALLREGGFQVYKSKLVKTHHPHDDFRFSIFVAARKARLCFR